MPGRDLRPNDVQNRASELRLDGIGYGHRVPANQNDAQHGEQVADVAFRFERRDPTGGTSPRDAPQQVDRPHTHDRLMMSRCTEVARLITDQRIERFRSGSTSYPRVPTVSASTKPGSYPYEAASLDAADGIPCDDLSTICEGEPLTIGP